MTSEQAIVRVLDVNVYVRPERDGLMLGGYEPDPLQVDMPRAARHVPNRRPGPRLRAAVPPDRGGAPRVSGAAAEIDQFRGGLPTMTADGRHIIDRVPGLQGFFVASGCCVGALSISPAVGEVLADWMVDGQPPLDLSALGLTRFGPELQSDERLRDACLWRYAHHYVHAPA